MNRLRERFKKPFYSKWAFLMAYFETVLLALIWVHFENYAHACLFVIGSLCGFFALALTLKKVSQYLTRLFFEGASALLLVTVCLSLMPSFPMFSGSTRYKNVDVPRDSLFADRRVMVVVPHQDDELILMCGVLEEYVQAGSEVYVVFTTNGDYYGLGRRRIQEAVDVLGRLGIDSSHVVFLGYGDQWKTPYKHIYHAPDDALVKSHAGRYATYGSARHAVYEITPYTRENLLQGMQRVIEETLPDTLFCIDYDSHPDHRATSLFFDEAMQRVLQAREDYTPTVYKGFAYSLGWFGREDYYELNVRSSTLDAPDGLMPETNVYRWADRVRFPVSSGILSRTLFNSPAYALLKRYASQMAQTRAARIINGDRVFFLRHTGSLTYRAQLSASSGNAALLNDFKLYDSTDVTDASLAPEAGVWIPEEQDMARTVRVTFAQPVTLSQILLYDNPSLTDNVLNARITLSNGASFDTGVLPANGSEACVRFEAVENVEWFEVCLTETTGDCAGLTEIEAYDQLPADSARFIKLMNGEGDFVYDYLIDPSGTEDFSLYTYGLTGETVGRLRLEMDNADCSVSLVDGVLRVVCPEGESCTLTVTALDAEGETLCDRVYLSNPSASRRLFLRFVQRVEKIRFRLNAECEAEYYSEVFRYAEKRVQALIREVKSR